MNPIKGSRVNSSGAGHCSPVLSAEAKTRVWLLRPDCEKGPGSARVGCGGSPFLEVKGESLLALSGAAGGLVITFTSSGHRLSSVFFQKRKEELLWLMDIFKEAEMPLGSHQN